MPPGPGPESRLLQVKLGQAGNRSGSQAAIPSRLGPRGAAQAVSAVVEATFFLRSPPPSASTGTKPCFVSERKTYLGVGRDFHQRVQQRLPLLGRHRARGESRDKRHRLRFADNLQITFLTVPQPSSSGLA